MGKGKIDNLKSFKTVEEAREKGRKGGINSGIAKRKKRLMTDIYRKFLESKYGDEIETAMLKVVKRGDNSSVSLMREIRESTEGTTHNINIETDLDTMREKLIETLKKQNGNNPGTPDPADN